MSVQGQKAKYSLRADVIRFAPDSGHVATAAAFPFRAKKRHPLLIQSPRRRLGMLIEPSGNIVGMRSAERFRECATK
jgi:hypothetical protein